MKFELCVGIMKSMISAGISKLNSSAFRRRSYNLRVLKSLEAEKGSVCLVQCKPATLLENKHEDRVSSKPTIPFDLSKSFSLLSTVLRIVGLSQLGSKRFEIDLSKLYRSRCKVLSLARLLALSQVPTSNPCS